MKYAYGNGEPGCLFDFVDGPFDTLAEALDAVKHGFDLTGPEQRELKAARCLYFEGERRAEAGATYVEIFEVGDDWTCE